MSNFPRDVPDIIRIENDEIVVAPSKLDNLEIDIPENFDEATILTHCTNCLKKHELSYSHKFPDEISFNCAGCSETNIVTSREHSYYSSLDSALIDRIRKRDSFVAGSKYSNTQYSQELMEKEQTLNRVFNFIWHTYLKFMVGSWVFSIATAILAPRMLNTAFFFTNFLVSVAMLLMIHNAVSGKTLSDRAKDYILSVPKDTNQQFRRDAFIKGLESQIKCSKNYRADDKEDIETERTQT